MDSERDPHTSYRVERMPGALFSVTTYPPTDTYDNGITIEENLLESKLPTWVRTSMDMLDMASTNDAGAVPFFGTRSGNIYWFQSTQIYNAGTLRDKES